MERSQVLMDEEHRDMYNRFGSSSFEFDPRKDELKLMTDVAVEYLFFGLTAYLMTLPLGARSARTWLTILGIVMLAVEVMFKLTETTLPDWMPETLTEHEVIFYLHSFFPLVVTLLRMLSESLYVDVDQTALAVLKEVYLQQKVQFMTVMLLLCILYINESHPYTCTFFSRRRQERYFSSWRCSLSLVHTHLHLHRSRTAAPPTATPRSNAWSRWQPSKASWVC